ncbi:MAG: hypothetical protein EHM42_06250 [Planctomycetaceae bacterium]|nr:MAG: hypothetical protein EHM42_06250 [Planctomycetaceae bacterium]
MASRQHRRELYREERTKQTSGECTEIFDRRAFTLLAVKLLVLIALAWLRWQVRRLYPGSRLL